jgi:hypothetical protein
MEEVGRQKTEDRMERFRIHSDFFLLTPDFLFFNECRFVSYFQ